jgi:glycosyltransferase involved in cell wall biosynthesis
MSKKPKLSVIIPAYNEAEAIGDLLDDIVNHGLHHQHELIVIDDGSTDNTATIVQKYPVKLIKHKNNLGYGAALKTGIRRACGHKVIMLDSDGQHDPQHISQIEEMLNEHVLVIGERTEDSFQVSNRQAGKQLIRLVGEYLFEQKLPDYNSGFRGFDRQLIKGMLHMMPNGFSFSTTSTMAFIAEGYSVGTIPIVVKERQGRPSNVKFIRDGSKTLLLLLRIIMLFNPLKIFFPVSIFVASFGFMWGLYGFVTFGRFANTAVLIVIMGMLLFFFGLIADQLAILNRRSS